jgi:hypothetical protein
MTLIAFCQVHGRGHCCRCRSQAGRVGHSSHGTRRQRDGSSRNSCEPIPAGNSLWRSTRTSTTEPQVRPPPEPPPPPSQPQPSPPPPTLPHSPHTTSPRVSQGNTSDFAAPITIHRTPALLDALFDRPHYFLGKKLRVVGTPPVLLRLRK